jgi:tRNA A-37 threonylcarbamoyl transferase component Bud32
MSQKKLNCWEYMQCQRQPDGKMVSKLGGCPAATDDSFDGINYGKNAGRICWAVAGTCCGGEVQGTFAEKRNSCTGCEFYQMVQEEEATSESNRKFLSYFSKDEANPLLKKMTCRPVKAGERFIIQGDIGEQAFIIQRGSCLQVVEKGGELHPVGHLGRGDIVGATSLLTEEPQNFHVEAETDMELWILERSLFDDISKENPDLLDFFTEIVASRFDSRRPTADRVIGKYIATDIIGQGAYSIVYRGVHQGLNRPVAIKMMRHNLAIDPEFQNTFRNEAKTIAAMNHPNIIRIYDIEERYRTMFIIEELVEGQSLKELLGHLRAIPLKATVDFLIQICTGLEYAHSKAIIHRDINATNILVQTDDHLKILDFGLACPIGTEDYASSGNVAYMAPEQVDSLAMDQRTDIYAVGITAYEMITGRRPFPEDNARDLLQMHLECEIPDPCDILPTCPRSLRDFIMKACRLSPEDRYQDAAGALKDLLRIGEEIGLPGRIPKAEPPNIASLFLVYENHQQAQFKELMDRIRDQAKELGISMKAADFHQS